MAAPMFSILHPSARPHKWREIYDAWIKAAVHPENVEYVLCVDERWGFGSNSDTFNSSIVKLFAERGRIRDKLIWNVPRIPEEGTNAIHGRRCYVDSVNIAAKSSTGSILIVIADDQYPCERWDSRIQHRLVNPDSLIGWPWTPNDWAMEADTGTPNEHARGMMVMPILSRERYQRLGYVFYPRYESMYADNDFYEHAKQDGVIIDARHLMFPHRHPSFKVPCEAGLLADEQYIAQNRPEAYALGERILEWRRRVQFGSRIDEAEKIDGWMTREELEALSFWAAQNESVTEIGAYLGRTTYALASGCAGAVMTIDNLSKPWEPSFRSQERELKDNVGHFHNLSIKFGDSAELAGVLPDTDMTFIDGDHSYEQVEADLEAWTGKTKRLICGHDFCETDAPGVVRAVRERFGDSVRVGPGRLWSVNLCGPNGAPGDPATFTDSSLSSMKQRPTIRRNIAVALPGENFSGAWVAKLLELLFNLQKTWNFCSIINYTSSAGITRQTICQQIEKMAPDFIPDYILWIDDDQIVEPGIIDMLLADADSIPDADLVAGWTWIASSGAHHNEPQVSCGRMDLDRGEISHAEYKSVQAAGGVFEVHWTGFPVVVMRYPAVAKAGRHPFSHYPCENSPWGECGEDISFCKRLGDAGGKIMVDSRAFVPHLKLKALGPVPSSKEEIALTLSGRSAPIMASESIREKEELEREHAQARLAAALM